MTKVILLTNSDINVRKNFNHFEIITDSGEVINLTPEAAEELVKSISEIKRKEFEAQRLESEIEKLSHELEQLK